MSYDLNGRVIIQRFIVETRTRREIYHVSEFFKKLNKGHFDLNLDSRKIYIATWEREKMEEDGATVPTLKCAGTVRIVRSFKTNDMGKTMLSYDLEYNFFKEYDYHHE